MRLISDDDHILAIRENRMLFAMLGAELLDQRKDVAPILAQEQAEMS